MPTYYGDLHNHNGLGYGLGSLERTIQIARSHLDFLCFTGHSSWHDMPAMEAGREANWINGFEKFRAAWPDVQKQTAEANSEGDFVTFLGFEWHSSRFGDQCVIFPEDHRPLIFPDHIEDLRNFCIEESALMIPHHLGYATGHRGVNWDVFDPICTPVVEVFSEHGAAEEDRGPYPFFNHSMGGRVTANTVRSAFERGLRFGLVASTDNHRGFPGAYGEGLMAVIAKSLRRADLLEALRARRTYALTGDRIEIDFTVDGHQMGSDLNATGSVQVRFDIQGRDEIDVVELIQDGRIVHRQHPEPGTRNPEPGPALLRLEYGWGPWADMDLDRVADWRFGVEVSGGSIERVFPCWQSGPFDEDRRHQVDDADANHVQLTSYSGRKGAFRGNPNQHIVLELRGDPDTRFRLDVIEPGKASREWTLGRLLQESQAVFTGPFPAESLLVHRVVTPAESSLAGEVELTLPTGPCQVYLRVRQRNGHMAWTSPVFVNY